MADSRVILVHGVWMGAWSGRALKHRLANAGFEVTPFAYDSVRAPLEASVHRLQAVIDCAPQGTHLVGHSLGGVLILEYLARRTAWFPGRVVLLAVPCRGSQVAQRLARSVLGRLILGRALSEWQPPPDGYSTEGMEIGVIAGDRPYGVGRLLMRGLSRPNDGTVALAETDLPGARDRLLLPETHSTLLISGRTAAAVIQFLRRGHFGAQPPEATRP